MKTCIKGVGFDSETGGFKALLIDGVEVPAEQVAAANERIRDLEADSERFHDKLRVRREQLAAEREVSDKLEKALTQVASEFYQYTEGFTILWAEIDAALAEVAAIRNK